MNEISRGRFIRQCLGMSAFVGFTAGTHKGFSQAAPDEFYTRLVTANNEEVAKLLQTLSADITEIRRRLGFDFANLAAAYCEPASRFYQKTELVEPLLKIIRFLQKAQHADGTLDLGNLASPPDTAFILEPLTAAATILNQNKCTALTDIKNRLKEFILKAGESLRTGGVHTPNHRWVVSAALAKINALFPNPAYVNRIQEWMSEGIYMYEEGNYLERSMNYSAVIDRALVTMARLLNRPALLDMVRKNLQLVYQHCEPNGELVTVDSRRQDQFSPVSILLFYHDYLYLSIHDANPEFAAIARYIEGLPLFNDYILRDLLVHYLEEPLYKKTRPVAKAPSTNFEVFIKHTNLVRIRRGNSTTTLFGGADFPIIIASGRSTSPNFFSFRKGAAILKYMRLSTDFFSTGYFHSQGITHEAGQYILRQRQEVPYYQPLPAQYRRADGDYAHTQSTDGRFWNKMDFGHRPQSNVKTLETTITAKQINGSNQLTFQVTGEAGVRVTLELCFKEGGSLRGLTRQEGSPDAYFLKEGTGVYQSGPDTITFGPGKYEHSKTTGLEGELYSSHFGTLRTDGMHVYLTGKTPFTHTLTLE